MRKLALTILAVFSFMWAIAQRHEVTGRVMDESGKPISGASVLVKGTQNGASTNGEGVFRIQVDGAGARLVISFVGYSTKELAASQASVVVLVISRQTTDSVVVIGYGTMRKSDVTGSVSSVKSSDLLAQPITNALEGLQGRVAGVDIALNSGAPGGLPSVIIRGIGSINSSTDPLYVVDGEIGRAHV